MVAPSSRITFDTSNQISTSEKTTSKNCCSSFCSRLWSRLHCSQFGTTAGAVASLVMTGLSGFIAYASYPDKPIPFGVAITVGVFSLCSCVTQAVATIYLCAWKPQKKLEQNIQQLGTLTQNADQEVQKLTQQIETLQNLNKTLEDECLQQKQQFTSAQQSIGTKVAEIELLNTKISTITSSLKIAQELVAQWEKAAKAIQGATTQFSTIDLSQEVTNLHKDLLAEQQIFIQIEEATEGLEEAKASIQTQNQTLQQLISTLGQGYTTLLTDISTKQSIVQQLKSELSSLSVSIQSLQTENSKLTQMKESADTLLKSYEQANSQLSQLLPLLQNIDMQKLQHFLNTQEKP